MRAWRTAAVVTDGRDITPEPDAALQERMYIGLFGTPVGTLDWRVDPPACESLETFVHRTGHGLSRWLAREDDPEGDLLLVSHGGVLLVLAALTGVDLHTELRRNATPILFQRASGGWEATAAGVTQARWRRDVGSQKSRRRAAGSRGRARAHRRSNRRNSGPRDEPCRTVIGCDIAAVAVVTVHFEARPSGLRQCVQDAGDRDDHGLSDVPALIRQSSSASRIVAQASEPGSSERWPSVPMRPRSSGTVSAVEKILARPQALCRRAAAARTAARTARRSAMVGLGMDETDGGCP